MDLWDIEGHAAHLYQLAGEDPYEPPGTAALAVRLFKSRRAVRYRPLMKTRAVLTRAEDRWEIWLRQGLSAADESFLIGHEIAEWYLRSQQVEVIEQACDALGAALVAPRQAFVSVLRTVGPNYPKLARAFGSTQSLAAMRLAETTGRPLALVTPERVRVRGEWSAPETEPEIRALAAARRIPGLRKTTLRDDPRRVALTIA